MKKIASLLCLCFIFLGLDAQLKFSESYSPIYIQDSIPPKLSEKYKNDLKALLSDYTDRTDKSKFYKTRYTDRTDEILDAMREKDVYYDGPLYDYLNSILNNILEANNLPKDVHLFPVRYTVANACSFCEGTIFFNIGLLNQLENEDQVALVIGHELAHYYNRHVNKGWDKYYKTISDAELKKNIKNAIKQEYNVYHTIDSLLKKTSLKLLFHTRENEHEADTMGLKLILKTKYDATTAPRLMEILDSCDLFKGKNDIKYKELFGFAEYPFKDHWMKYEMDDMWHEKEDDKEYTKSDTLKTHPDCKKRRAYMLEMVGTLHLSPKPLNDGKESGYTYADIRRIARFEMIEADFWHENYGKSLFRALNMLPLYPDNAYLQAMVGKNLYEIYIHQKKHTLGRHIVQPYVTFDDHYNQFLGFVQQLSLTDASNLCYLYVTKRADKYKSCDDFSEALFMARIAKGEGDPKTLAESFIKEHPDNKRLIPEIKSEFIPKEDSKKKVK